MADDYVCTLTEASQKKAKEELHEDPKERLSCVATFKEWIVSQPHITCEGDTRYLLSFLRASKFSQLVARERLEKWLSVLDIMKQWLRDIDFCDPQVQQFYDSGVVVPLPGTDEQGCKVCLHRPALVDLSLPKDVAIKCVIASNLFLLLDENTQVNGIRSLIDFTGYEMKHMTYFGMDDMKKMAKLWSGAIPGRFKGYHYYNTGTVFETIMQAILPVLTKKVKERIFLLGNNLENVYKVFPMEMLPDEYLPDDYTGKSAGPAKALIEQMKKEMTSGEVLGRMRFATGPGFGMDASKREEYEQASFRQLDVQ